MIRLIGCTVSIVLIQLSFELAAHSEPPIADAQSKAVVLSGRVIDEDSKPIAGATVLANNYSKEINSETPADHIRITDRDGRFKIRLHRDIDDKNAPATDYLWAYKPGYNIRCVATGGRSPSEQELVLGKITEVSFLLQHPDGIPFDSARAAPYEFSFPNGRYSADTDTGLSGPLPKTVRELLSCPITPDGSVAIKGVPTLLLESIEVTSAALGKQIVNQTRPNNLVACGSLEGVIVSPAEDLPETVDVFVSIQNNQSREIAHYFARTDDSGAFSFPLIPSGNAEITVNWPVYSSVIPVPKRPAIRVIAKQANTISIPVIPTVDIRGRVVLSDTSEPVKNGRLRINSKRFPGVSRHVQTNEDGWYGARLPSGEITVQLFSMREALTHQYPGQQPFTVPDNVKQFELGSIQVDPKSLVRGFVIDKRGDRVPNRYVVIWSPRFGHLNGLCKTDEEGRFELMLTNDQAERLRTTFQAKKNGEPRKWELKVVPPTELSTRQLYDHIANIKEFPSVKIRSFRPVVVQIGDPQE